MRRILMCSFLAVVLAALAIGAGPASSAFAVEGQQFRQVNIRVSCDNDEVDEVNIRPWTAGASGEEQLRWRLLPASHVESAIIRPKSTSEWPFGSTPPLTVSGGGQNAVDSGPITGAAGSYFYDIVVDCGSGPTVIDPRMDIGG